MLEFQLVSEAKPNDLYNWQRALFPLETDTGLGYALGLFHRKAPELPKRLPNRHAREILP